MYNPLVEKAIAYSISAHDGQQRKGQPGVPYVVHPLHVGMLLARHGFDADVVAAGILHDVMEDTGVTQEELAEAFDARIAAIVAEVSEEKGHTWEARKQRTVDAIADMSEGARAVTAADKVHNLADLERLLAERGHDVWKMFRRGRDPTLDYYHRVLDQLERHFPHPLTKEMGELLARIETSH
jgi:(p)ppGpp synthase/HD superfamily hydrolase